MIQEVADGHQSPPDEGQQEPSESTQLLPREYSKKELLALRGERYTLPPDDVRLLASLGIYTSGIAESVQEFQPSRGYATRKTMSLGGLAVALMMANACQLTALLDVPDNHDSRFYVALIVLIALSLMLLVATGGMLLFLGVVSPKTEAAMTRVTGVNNATLGVVFAVTVVNVFITAFGITFVADNR
ncbi:hypothetical protein ACOMHN_016409 [Nucella lapillus]